MSSIGALKMAGVAHERPGDDPAEAPGVGLPAGDATEFVETPPGDDAFVGGDLQDRVSGGVENGFPGLQMLGPEFFENHRPAARAIAEKLDVGIALDRADEFRWKLAECGERLVADDAGDFPMAGRGVLTGGAFAHAAEARDRAPRAGIEDIGGEDFP